MSADPDAAQSLEGAPRSRLRRWLRDVSELDTRSLGVFRIGLALCMLWDLALRWPLVHTFYSDSGVLPRSALASQVPEYATPLALYLAFGGELYPHALFALTAVAALALALGWRTRAIVPLCWWLELALQMRNPFALNGGNHQLRMALFWSMFLPLGARFSLDARRAREAPPARVTGIEAAALWIQVAIIYFSAGLAKQSPQWIQMGNALHWTMIDPDWTRPLAAYAAQVPELLRVLTFATVGLEYGAPLLFFVTGWSGWVRAAAVIGLIALQTGIGLTMRLGVFPQVSISVLCGLLPAVVWGARGALAGRAPARPRARRLRAAFAGVCLLWVVAYTTAFWTRSTAFPPWLELAGRTLKLDQYWTMYYTVHRAQFHLDFRGTTAGGVEVGLAHPGFDGRWHDAAQRPAQNPFWREYASNLQGPEREFLRAGLAAYWCREWNAQAPPDAQLAEIELLYVARYLSLTGAHGEWAARSEGRFACEGRS
jgi:hypothetical protein